MVAVYYSRLGECMPSETYRRYLGQVPENLHARITRYQRWEDCQAGLISRLLLIESLKEFGVGAGILHNMRHDANKRPYLDGSLDFNLSHSGNWIICAVSDTHRVGVDVERVRPVPLDDFCHVLSESEQETILTKPDPFRRFYELWTQKEAVAKADGRGLLLPFTSIVLYPGGADSSERHWFLHKITVPDDGHVAYLATDQRLNTPVVREIQFDYGGALKQIDCVGQ